MVAAAQQLLAAVLTQPLTQGVAAAQRTQQGRKRRRGSGDEFASLCLMAKSSMLR
jgi:hypothetical protein